MWGRGRDGRNGARSTLHRILVFHSATRNQTGPLWCWFLSGWACACPRPLWVSPMTSPVRLGVSPAAAPTPTGVFNQRFEALFPRTGALGCMVCLALCPPSHLSVHGCGAARSATHHSAYLALRHSESGHLGLSVRECGAAGSASGQTACPIRHSPPVSVLLWQRESSPPGCPPQPLLPVWMNVYFLSPWCRTSLPFDFLSVLAVRGGIVCLPTPPSWLFNLSLKKR